MRASGLSGSAKARVSSEASRRRASAANAGIRGAGTAWGVPDSGREAGASGCGPFPFTIRAGARAASFAWPPPFSIVRVCYMESAGHPRLPQCGIPGMATGSVSPCSDRAALRRAFAAPGERRRTTRPVRASAPRRGDGASQAAGASVTSWAPSCTGRPRHTALRRPRRLPAPSGCAPSSSLPSPPAGRPCGWSCRPRP